MADFYTIKPEVAISSGGQLREKQHDNGDGTSSPAVYVEGVTITGPVTVSNEVEVKNETGNPVPVSVTSLPLPTGAATSANQTTGNTSLGSIDSKLTSQATAANQTTANTSLSSIDTKLSSQATAANQSTANASLSSIDTKLAGVALASNQATLNGSVGATNDTAATSDTGTFSLIALFKRLLTKMAFSFETVSGGLKVQEQYIPGYEDNIKNRALVQRPGIPLTISTATTTTLTGPYHINNVRVLGGTLGNVTIYDAISATGTPIVPTFTPDKGQVLLDDIDVLNGLTIVTASATIIVVSYGY